VRKIDKIILKISSFSQIIRSFFADIFIVFSQILSKIYTERDFNPYVGKVKSPSTPRNSAITKIVNQPKSIKTIAKLVSWEEGKWKWSLSWLLILLFVPQIVGAVGLVGYLSYRNGQKSVKDITIQKMEEVGSRVEQKLTSYLETPRFVNQMNSDAVRRGSLSLDLEKADPQRDRFLWQRMQLFDRLSWISIGTEAGSSLGIWRPSENQALQLSASNRSNQYFGTYYAIDDRGKRIKILKVERPAFDPRTRPWYKKAIAAEQPIWTEIYAGFTPGTIFIAASQPLYDNSGKLLGVSAVDLSLLAIQTFLVDTPVSRSGHIFLFEKSGELVASSTAEKPFRTLEGQPPQRVNVLDSENQLIRATARVLQEQSGDLNKIRKLYIFDFMLDEERYFVRVLPYSKGLGLNWSIAIVVPEADVMERIHASTRTTIWLCLGALAVVIASNIAISRRLVRPIVELSRASQKIARNDFTTEVRTPRVRELFQLASSFEQMSQEIQKSRQQLEDYSLSLEQKVQDRTRSLQQEIERRAAAEEALSIANRELQKLAYIDGLTEIANRRLFDDRLSQEWRRLQRERQPLSLILCDVDYFKQYNDAYGHQSGDECLCQVAKVLDRTVHRQPDLAARYGGEEFVVLLPNTHLEGAIEVANKIRMGIKSLQMPHCRSQVSQYVTISLGVACTIPNAAATPEQLLERADLALYRAKRDGRDRITSYEPLDNSP
jgi:diguanylate cyclase (GGDEF)-like protein